jgi:hypothetical protein
MGSDRSGAVSIPNAAGQSTRTWRQERASAKRARPGLPPGGAPERAGVAFDGPPTTQARGASYCSAATSLGDSVSSRVEVVSANSQYAVVT